MPGSAKLGGLVPASGQLSRFGTRNSSRANRRPGVSPRSGYQSAVFGRIRGTKPPVLGRRRVPKLRHWLGELIWSMRAGPLCQYRAEVAEKSQLRAEMVDHPQVRSSIFRGSFKPICIRFSEARSLAARLRGARPHQGRIARTRADRRPSHPFQCSGATAQRREEYRTLPRPAACRGLHEPAPRACGARA